MKHIKQNINPITTFRNTIFVKQLPKTKSNKIPRSTLSTLINNKPYKINNLKSLILNPTIIFTISLTPKKLY